MTAESTAPRPVWEAAVLGRPGPDGHVTCELCPEACDLAPGQTGVCAVRRNHDGALQTSTSAASVQHVDAVERKPFFHVRPGGRVLTLAAPGCTFRCNYCVNHRLSQYGRDAGISWTARPVQPADLVARARADGLMLGLSYAEPALAIELTLGLAEAAGPDGPPVLWKSNGYLTAAAADLVAPALTAVNIDVKAAREAPHRRLTGAPLAPVLRTVERLRAAGVWVEVTTPLIPSVSDSDDDVRAIARWLAGLDPAIPWHLVRFVPDYRMRRPDPTAPERLRRAAQLAREAGIQQVYCERALGPDGRSTRCPRCDTRVVERGVWETLSDDLVAGTCPACHTTIPGRWSV
ncbi:AmmeMemoRadiSam system radical SAM enzyme [Dactylosporangium sp. NPDC049525]|uniref:AmmeMemoRadiSam system radical SAM enzyme n=1 Tax=Dactylosporangium sp. NPDC049525 TaxID=3154730 RepID=UPI003422CB19